MARSRHSAIQRILPSAAAAAIRARDRIRTGELGGAVPRKRERELHDARGHVPANGEARACAVLRDYADELLAGAIVPARQVFGCVSVGGNELGHPRPLREHGHGATLAQALQEVRVLAPDFGQTAGSKGAGPCRVVARRSTQLPDPAPGM